MHHGKSCLVVGGTHGIGLAIATTLADQGASQVIVCSRKQSSVDQAVRVRPNVFKGVVCNVGKVQDVLELVRTTEQLLNGSKLDILVSNVGIDPVAGRMVDASEELFDKIFHTNVRVAWLLTKSFMPHFGRGSSILLVSSVGGFQPLYPAGLYGTSKTALIGLGRALASELGGLGVRVNVICPGLVKTRMSESFWKGPYAEQAEKMLFLRRLGEPSDIASVASFLLSDQSNWLTGEAVVVSGGSQSRL